MAHPDFTRCEPHDEAEELLPWYATGQLEERDRIKVEMHLSSCSRCREQLCVERRMVSEFRAIVPEVESGWARLRQRIDRPQLARQRGNPNLFNQFWTLLPRPALATLATAQLALLLVAGGLLVMLLRPAYHTLGSAAAPAAANLIVMFSPDMRVREVDQVLKSSGASIVEGPTETHAYLLHVDSAQRGRALSHLRHQVGVQLAEPIDGVLQ